MNLSQRSTKKELLDGLNIPFRDIKLNMKELEFINTYLGGHKITIDGLSSLLKNACFHNDRKIVICEIGCGGGDNMLAIQKWCKANRIEVQLIGIDINPYCIEVASEKFAGTDTSFITRDYKRVVFEAKPDYIFTSLFCHHFTDDQLVTMLGWMQLNAVQGFFINDLHRNKLAFYSISLLTKWFSRSYLVKNDAPLSVLRGFRKEEWECLLKTAGIDRYVIKWKWAFRHLIMVQAPTI